MSESTPKGRGMTLTDHLVELRKRLVRCLISVAVCFFICYHFAMQMFNFLMKPLVKALPQGSHLIYTSPAEAFYVELKMGVVAAIFMASPYIFYQLWQFIAPGLYSEERKYIVPIAAASAIFFILGAAFGYYVVFPFVFEFFMSYGSNLILPMPTLGAGFSFSAMMLLAFGVIFELPLFIFFLARMGLVSAKWLRKQQRYAILVIFIVAAILTPPDPFTQSLMAVPMCILYEIGIWVAFFFGKKKRSDAEQPEAEVKKEKAASASAG